MSSRVWLSRNSAKDSAWTLHVLRPAARRGSHGPSDRNQQSGGSRSRACGPLISGVVEPGNAAQIR